MNHPSSTGAPAPGAVPPDHHPVPARIAGLDIARGLALVAMAIFHLGWDLNVFGLVDADVVMSPPWRSFARCIAGSFLTLVGIGLALAHGQGVRVRPFLRRLGLVAAGALGVTAATKIVFPNAFIYFGILHCIALASVLALPFLRAPLAIVLVVACACFLAPPLLRDPAFNHPALLWLGLAESVPATTDYEPILPWFGFVLTGIVLARTVLPHLPSLPARLVASPPARLLALAGRHSLAVYLAHQPILFGAVWLAAILTEVRRG